MNRIGADPATDRTPPRGPLRATDAVTTLSSCPTSIEGHGRDDGRRRDCLQGGRGRSRVEALRPAASKAEPPDQPRVAATAAFIRPTIPA
ncbi:hypothetical protein GCM10027400_10520 [Pseudoxanthomonas daejeonensis]